MSDWTWADSGDAALRQAATLLLGLEHDMPMHLVRKRVEAVATAFREAEAKGRRAGLEEAVHACRKDALIHGGDQSGLAMANSHAAERIEKRIRTLSQEGRDVGDGI